jgi:hypothetical protein
MSSYMQVCSCRQRQTHAARAALPCLPLRSNKSYINVVLCKFVVSAVVLSVEEAAAYKEAYASSQSKLLAGSVTCHV